MISMKNLLVSFPPDPTSRTPEGKKTGLCCDECYERIRHAIRMTRVRIHPAGGM